MNKIILILATLFVTTMSLFAQNKTSLTGIVTDQKDGSLLIGASIYFPDLKIGTTTDTNGRYQIKELPKTRLLVEINYMGYNPSAQQIDLTTSSTQNFKLKEAVTELGEVVVTGLSKATRRTRTPSPISVFTPLQLKQLSATNIVDALTNLPGVSQISTGSSISKPIIRGLGYNRVLVVNDGIRQEGQQWGDEHGVEIDEYSINRVEVLKGPASLAYGSDAMAGVINFQPAPTLQEGSLKGNFLANYQTNSGLIGGSLNLGGNQKGFVWDVRYSQKVAHSYKNKYDGYVLNSGFNENNIGGMLGLNKSWGYAHLKFSSYNLKPGIIEGARDPVTGQFVKPIANNDSIVEETIASNTDLRSYNAFIPYQKIHHYKLVSNNNFYIGKGALKVTLGWQQNQRKEFEEILNPNEYGLYLNLNTINYDLRYNHSINNTFDLSFGTNGMYQNSKNKGSEFLIPDYNLFDIGIFALAKKSWIKWTLSGGLRYDLRSEHGKDLWLDADDNIIDYPDINSEHLFSAFNSKFQGVSGSIGATYQIKDIIYTKLNFSKGFRSPNIAELTANGVHSGSAQYLIGSPILKPENSYQVDYTFGINSEHVTLETDLFYNNINNYIFLEKLNNNSGGDSITNGYQTYKYTSGNAFLYGGEISLDIHPHPFDWLHFETHFSFVQAVQSNQVDSMRYLPFTPAPKLQLGLRADIKGIGSHLSKVYFKIGVENYFNQNHIYKAFGTETATPGYTLLNSGVGTDIIRKKRTLFSIYIRATNLTNIAYQSHLSRLKYLDVNNATGRTGIYNMGRNISLKLIVPIDIKK
ncbi:MAG TPA: TonB-dependent receptor [Edaphocola sp.]|nr:TonB-dependent receptor [Edaphocola sp.]